MYKVYQSWEFFTVVGGAGCGGGAQDQKKLHRKCAK